MIPVKTLTRCVVVVLALALAVVAPAAAAAQDSTGRPTGPTGKPKKPRGRPGKVIRGRSKSDVEKVPSSSVIIRSYPPGAEVFIDGELVGTTADDGELELSDMRLGAHRIVLRKDGYREWSQTVILRSSTETEEIEPLLQAENSQYLRDLGKVPVLDLGREVKGQVSRESIALSDGTGFYSEYWIKLTESDALIIVLKPVGFRPSIKLVDDSNILYPVQPVSESVYQTVTLPKAGNYYLQVIAPLDESTYSAGEFSLVVMSEKSAHGPQPIAIGASVTGSLDVTDSQSGPGDYYDAWTIAGQVGTRVRISVDTAGGFVAGLTLLLDGRVVATSGKGDEPKKKPKGKGKGKDEPQGSSLPEILTTLTGGTYTIYVRSLSGAKQGTYTLSVTMAN